MCYSFESNYNSWFVSLISCVILLLRNPTKSYIWVSLFTLTFAQIQVIEAMIWSHVEKGDMLSANKLAKYIVPLLWAQPIVNCICAYNFTGNPIMLPLIFIYLIIFLYQYQQAFYVDETYVKVEPSGHLGWYRNDANGNFIGMIGGWTFGIIYLVGLFLPGLYVEDPVVKYMSLAFFILSFAQTAIMFTPQEFSSVWCNVSVGFIVMHTIAGTLM